MAIRSTNPNFLNGVPELLVLRLLEEQEMYGYEIVQALRSRTAEVITAGEGVVYPVLHVLESEGAVGGVWAGWACVVGASLWDCLPGSVVGLEDLFAREFDSVCTGRGVGGSLLWYREVDLLRGTCVRGVGAGSDGGTTAHEGDMA